MESYLSRREFLKLLALFPLLQLKLPYFINESQRPAVGRDLPNVLILVFDALSASQMSLYGYNRETTPNLAKFAERATVFYNHYAGGNFTSSGTASLLTGTYPWSHRAIHLHGTVSEYFKNRNLFSLFAREGYESIAYSHNLLVTSLLHQFQAHLDTFLKTRELCLVDDQFSDRLFPKDFNVSFWSEWLVLRGGETHPGSLFLSLLHRAFRYAHKREILTVYGELFPRGVPNLHNLYFILEDAIDWIKSQLSTLSQPYLAYFHLLPPHEPYTTRKDFVDLFKDGWKPQPKPVGYFGEGMPEKELLRNRREYDEYLAYADAEFGRLYEFMRRSNMLENTYVVFTSDHGEMFERGIRGHVTPTLYQPLLRVPLIIAKPGQRERQDVYSSTSCVDLIPTLLQLIGQPLPDWLEGKILPTFNAEQIEDERPIYAVEAKSNPKQSPLRKGTISLVKGDYKLTHYFGYKDYESDFEFYDLSRDPQEMRDLITSKKSLAADLQQELEAKIQEVNQPYLQN